MPEFLVATQQHFSVIQELWHEGFPEDTAEDVEEFWRCMSGESVCLLCKAKGEFVSMAFLIPAKIGCDTWWYVYAASTCRDRRGKGYFTALLDEAARRATEQNVAGLFLRPASPSLFDYYTRCGFVSAFPQEIIKWKAKALYSKNVWYQIKSEYAKERNTRLSNMGVDFVRWPSFAAEYARKMAEESGGGVFVCDKATALCECRDGVLIVRELLCKQENREEILLSLTSEFPCQEVVAYSPACEGENILPYGMVRPCRGGDVPKNCYLGLTFE